jgi:hypothetical protein
VSPVKYELGFYIPEDDILYSHHRENLKSYMDGNAQRRPLTNTTVKQRERFRPDELPHCRVCKRPALGITVNHLVS